LLGSDVNVAEQPNEDKARVVSLHGGHNFIGFKTYYADTLGAKGACTVGFESHGPSRSGRFLSAVHFANVAIVAVNAIYRRLVMRLVASSNSAS
jgi:hypothetical protein